MNSRGTANRIEFYLDLVFFPPFFFFFVVRLSISWLRSPLCCSSRKQFHERINIFSNQKTDCRWLLSLCFSCCIAARIPTAARHTIDNRQSLYYEFSFFRWIEQIKYTKLQMDLVCWILDGSHVVDTYRQFPIWMWTKFDAGSPDGRCSMRRNCTIRCPCFYSIYLCANRRQFVEHDGRNRWMHLNRFGGERTKIEKNE